MPNVIIRHCVMRVVRRGGWSWGPEPRRLAADAARALPALLADELDRVLPEDVEGELSAPLQLDVRVGLADLRAWARRGAPDAAGSPAMAPGPIGGASSPVPEAIARAVRRALDAAPLAVTAARPAPIPDTPPELLPLVSSRRAAAVLNVLVAWRAASALEGMLRALPDAAVAAWHRALLEWEDAPSLPPEVAESPSLAPLEPFLARLAAQSEGAGTAGRLRLRVQVAVELAAARGVPPSSAFARATIAERLPFEPIETSAASSRAEARVSTVTTAKRAEPRTEVRIASALPFLLLGPLHRTGWIDMADATFAAADLLDTLPTLAIGLATKVLPEPERGWRRTSAAITASAAFAGDGQQRDDSEIGALARLAAPLAPALDAVTRRSLLDGRHPGEILLLCAAGGARLLVDPPGVFLLAVADAGDVESLAAVARESRAPLFVPEDAADARLTAALDEAGVVFVTPARPVRGETWRAVPGTRAPRLFSNGRAGAVSPPPDNTGTAAGDIWAELVRRPLPGRPADPALDRCLALAAAMALGTIAWELWRHREPTHPALTLERFGDLEGTVRFEARRVRVRLPLGKRFRDLKTGGFLEDVPRVPWLGFRTVEFSGG